MALDIIYPIILTPIAFAVGYGIHAFRKSMKQELPEAKPYEFLFGLTFVLLVYKVYADEKKSQSYLEEIYRLHRINTELEGELWQNRIDLQTATNQLNLAKMSHEKTKQELEDKARTWENQYNSIKNESGRN